MQPESAAVILFLAGGALQDLRKREISLLYMAFFAVPGLFMSLRCGRGAADLLAAVLPGLLCVAWSVAGQGQIGCGDGLAAVVIGLYLGAADVLEICLTGFVLASIPAGVLFLKNRRGRDTLPFLPFLFAGSILAAFSRIL